jgi:23S rRNA (guanosine2251-2'-O)-methyltransferase
MNQRHSPKDRFITVYGRKPVLEALTDPALRVDKVLLATNVTGASAREIVDAAARRGVEVRRETPHRVKLLAGNGRHDQGVLADVEARGMATVASYLTDRQSRPGALLLLDGVTTPANVGMILRTATAAGMDGVVVPHRGVASLDPLVVKASAGVAFRAPVLRAGTAAEAAELLDDAGYVLVGLDAGARTTLFDAAVPDRVCYVLGGETDGVSKAVEEYVSAWVSIPMAGDVESLNVASAAAVLCFDLTRRRSSRN